MRTDRPEIIQLGPRVRIVRCGAMGGLTIRVHDIADAVAVRKLMEEVLDARQYRECAHCGIKKPLKNFYTLVTAKDGYQANCIACCKAIARETYQRRLNWTHARRMQAGDFEHAA